MPRIIGVNTGLVIAGEQPEGFVPKRKIVMVDEEAKNAAYRDTKRHIAKVRHFLLKISDELNTRSLDHDASKLEEPELSLFAEWGPKLKEMEYGSDEYKAALEQMGVALEHHYQHNRHHPEHHGSGVSGMNLIDLIEMVCDWKAASLRMKDGDFLKSLEVQKERFGLAPQLVAILANTAEFFEEMQHEDD